MRALSYLLIILLLSISMTVWAQSPLDTLVMRAIMVNQLFPQEKVYLHFDNTSYYLGETMWFKAYVVGTADHTLHPQSKVLYVELVAPEGYVVETKKYKLDDKGCCSGEFDLKESILSGYYTVRAYTRYMLNWGDEAIFARTFPVYDAVSGGHYEIKDMLDRRRSPLLAEDRQQVDKMKYRLDFYPEGGHLIEEIPCVVAYELLRHDGKPMKDSITIFEDKRPLLRTAPEHNGKGTFHFTPRKGVQYRAEVKYVETNEHGRTKEQIARFALPVVEREGVGIAVREEADSFILDIRNNIENEISLGCAILNKGRMQLYEPFSSGMAHKTIILHRDSLPEGVCRLVVFANQDIPLAERQFFVRHDRVHSDDLHCVRLNVTTSEGVPIEDAELEPYEKVTLRIAREDGKPISPEASLSLSVTDADSREDIATGGNLYTHLLLGSELRGYIPDAFRYFDPKNVNRSRELDLVMLTHGWTSYDWSVLSNRHFDLKHPIEEGITVNGELLEFAYSRSKRHPNGRIPLSYEPMAFHSMFFAMKEKGDLQEYELMTDIDGSFKIHMDDFYGNHIISLSPKQEATRYQRPIMLIDKFFSPKSLPEQYLRFGLSDNLQTDILRMDAQNYLLPDVEIEDERRRNRYHLPPISEVRFNYLNEWERNYELYWRMRKLNLNNGDIMEDSIVTTLNGPWYFAPIYTYTPSNGEMTIADECTTPYKVVGATFLRNFVGCYWMHYLVADNKCLPDSIVMDEEYLLHMDFLNPFNFKEFFICDDYAVRRQFTRDPDYWAEMYNSIIKKNRDYFTGRATHYWNEEYVGSRPTVIYEPKWDLDYYHGFYANQILPPLSIRTDQSAYNHFLEKAVGTAQWIVHMNTGRYYARGYLPMDTPNYVACMVPYTDAERDSLYIPDGENGWNNRFTHIQGYSHSKRFYAPDYSNRELLDNEKVYCRTLLWNTEILPDSTGTIAVLLHNAPKTKKISVTVEGMSRRQIFCSKNLHKTKMGMYGKSRDIRRDLEIWRNIADTIHTTPSDLLSMHRDNVEGIRKLHEQQLDDAAILFKKSAMMQYPPAMANLGICYHRGWGVEKNIETAYKYYRLAAERGEASACHNLGGCYLHGEAVESNDSLAFIWYSRAAGKGFTQSSYILGELYENGKGTTRNDSMALKCYLAASTKYPEAAFAAAMLLVRNDSISGMSEAIHMQIADLVEQAADNGLLAAQKYIVDCYRDGRYVEINEKRMVEYLILCVRQGDEQSLLRLAYCYEKGIGVGKNKERAYDYYKRLAEKGHKLAKKKALEYEILGNFEFDRTKLKDL